MKLNAVQQFGVSLFTYLVLLFITFWAIGSDLFPGYELGIALTPLVPGFAIAYLGISAIRKMDELQRRVQLETLGIAFGGYFMLLVTESLLFAMDTLPRYGPGRYLMYMIAMWLISFMVARRRYE